MNTASAYQRPLDAPGPEGEVHEGPQEDGGEGQEGEGPAQGHTPLRRQGHGEGGQRVHQVVQGQLLQPPDQPALQQVVVVFAIQN